MQVSISDIAEMTGVSAMTVSRVINGSSSVSESTRKKVLEAVSQTGYRKDVFASINSSKRKGIRKKKRIAVNFPVPYLAENAFFDFFSRINMTVISELQKMGVDYSLIHIDENISPANLEPLISCDAVIYCGPLSIQAYKKIRDFNPELGAVSMCFSLDGVSSVNADDSLGGLLAARHFHGKGHRRIMCLLVENDSNFTERYLSFESNCRQLSPDIKIEALSYSREDVMKNKNCVEELLTDYFSKNNPDGVFVLNGYDTMLTYKTLRNMSIKIPAEIGLLGYDEFDIYNYLDTPLSRISFDRTEVGVAAASLACSIADGSINSPRKILIPVQLVDMKSVIDKSEMKQNKGVRQ